MVRTHWSPAILGMALMIIVATISSLFIRQGADASALAQVNPTPTTVPPVPTYYSFGVKFVCVYQPRVDLGEPPVKPGNYATEINIHNFTYRQPSAAGTTSLVGIRKKVLVLVDKGQVIGREPKQVAPRALDTIYLQNDGATMDDCNRIWQLLNPNTALPPSPMPLMIGYLVLISRFDLDVDAVYTAEVPGLNSQVPTGISQDVVRVAGKRVAIPNTLFPGGVLQP